MRVYFDACCFIDLAQSALKIKADADREPHVFFCKVFFVGQRV